MNESRERIRARAEALADWHSDLMEGLVDVREQHGLSQADVAEIMGVSQSAVSQFERSESNPTLMTIRRYALAVGATLRGTEVVSDWLTEQIAHPEGGPAWSAPRKVRRADVPWHDATKAAFTS